MDSQNSGDLRFEDPFPNDSGILLADKIHALCEKKLLISDDYLEKNLRPASYTLRIGDLYIDSEGNRGQLTKEHDSFVFKKNSIIFVSSKEKLNLPFYVIGRFNVRVTWVYNGVLLGTGPQVDPGFSGNLSCPLYNLTDLDIVIKRGDDFATIDFEKTSKLLEKASVEERKKIIEKAEHAKPLDFKGGKHCFYKLSPMGQLHNCKNHKMVSSLFEMRAELRNWRLLGIGAVVSFFGLTLSLLGFGTNVYRQETDNTRQMIEMKMEVQEAHAKVSELSQDLERIKSGLQQNQKPVIPPQANPNGKGSR